ncbi:hypothetical protein STVIR_1789 [Streptomyces viridochromogenes Tue57]|uniref:Uncharacterized protein n=1 Tax=Streptomyces viridochromogenes Tue57 TaxID=1160705 RepID=L8PMP7_STRVR|nr:hypothetical protein STVIR_1789 [Streptomyces viridochromogenes Tue57]
MRQTPLTGGGRLIVNGQLPSTDTGLKVNGIQRGD